MATQDPSPHEHETNPGMDALTLIYCTLFFILYLFYFWEVAIRWKVS